MEFLKW